MTTLQDMFNESHNSKFVKKICSLETRAKLSAANKGKTASDETRAKMSASSKGKTKTWSDEARLRVSNAAREGHCKQVITPLGVFSSLKQAGLSHLVSPECISFRIKTNKPGYSFIK